MTDLELHPHGRPSRKPELAARLGPTILAMLLAIAGLAASGIGWTYVVLLGESHATGWAELGRYFAIEFKLILPYSAIGLVMPGYLLARAIRRDGPPRRPFALVAMIASVIVVFSGVFAAALGSAMAAELNSTEDILVILALLPLGPSSLATGLVAWQSRASWWWVAASIAGLAAYFVLMSMQR